MENKSGIYKFFDDLKKIQGEDIEIGKIEENSKCIYAEFDAREFEYSTKDRTLTLANGHMQEVLEIDENYVVEIFYNSGKYYTVSIAFGKK